MKYNPDTFKWAMGDHWKEGERYLVYSMDMARKIDGEGHAEYICQIPDLTPSAPEGKMLGVFRDLSPAPLPEETERQEKERAKQEERDRRAQKKADRTAARSQPTPLDPVGPVSPGADSVASERASRGDIRNTTGVAGDGTSRDSGEETR